jgi:hypothetical protein
VVGETYSGLVTDPGCGDPSVTGVYQEPSHEMTTVDAYADRAACFRGDIDEARDVRLSATFVTVSEPGSWLLMLTGLIGIGCVGRWGRSLIA